MPKALITRPKDVVETPKQGRVLPQAIKFAIEQGAGKRFPSSNWKETALALI
ncbi:hypothetical protein GCM10010869_58920 [Mesorhizobium tianshanense]|nr:hypothetical protein GCM10010869_58920 [Mesorhizobium tianshanense]